MYTSEFNIAWFEKFGVIPQVIFDVGSYDGGDAFRYKQTFPTARVIAIEADPIRVFYVQKNLAATDIEVLHYAICDHDGTVDWYQSKLRGKVDSQGSMFKFNDPFRIPDLVQDEIPIEVPARRLDSLCAELHISAIDHLHIDSEGAELLVLKGLGELRPKLIFLELIDYWVGAPSILDVLAWLDIEGYREVATSAHNRFFQCQ